MTDKTISSGQIKAFAKQQKNIRRNSAASASLSGKAFPPKAPKSPSVAEEKLSEFYSEFDGFALCFY